MVVPQRRHSAQVEVSLSQAARRGSVPCGPWPTEAPLQTGRPIRSLNQISQVVRIISPVAGLPHGVGRGEVKAQRGGRAEVVSGGSGEKCDCEARAKGARAKVA